MSRRKKRTVARLGSAVRFVGLKMVPLIVVFAAIGELWPNAHAHLMGSPTFAVKQVLVSGNEFLTPAELLELGQVRPGMPLVALKPRAVEGRLALHPRVESADVAFAFPRGVRIRVVERKPIAQLEALAAGDVLRPIAADGVLLPPVSGRTLENVPIIAAGPDVSRQGDLVREPAVLEALSFLSVLDRADMRLARSVAVIDLTDERFGKVHLDSLDTSLVYEKGGAWRSHIRVLPGVFADLRKEHVMGTVLDLRFREQIVRRGGVFEHDELAANHAKVGKSAN